MAQRPAPGIFRYSGYSIKCALYVCVFRQLPGEQTNSAECIKCAKKRWTWLVLMEWSETRGLQCYCAGVYKSKIVGLFLQHKAVHASIVHQYSTAGMLLCPFYTCIWSLTVPVVHHGVWPLQLYHSIKHWDTVPKLTSTRVHLLLSSIEFYVSCLELLESSWPCYRQADIVFATGRVSFVSCTYLPIPIPIPVPIPTYLYEHKIPWCAVCSNQSVVQCWSM